MENKINTSVSGGINALTFQTDGSVDVSPVSLPQPILDRLQNNCLMFYTGKKRRASQILNHQKQRMSSTDTLPILHDMVALVPELKQALLSGNLDEFGRLLNVNWQLKKQLSPHISNTDIDELYELALKNGAIGGKLLGAGGAGFYYSIAMMSTKPNLESRYLSLLNYHLCLKKLELQ